MPTCFLIQPYDDKFNKRCKEVFKPAITAAGLDPYRPDEDASVQVPIEAIEEGIRNSAVCLADVTLDNPNVWYELGYAFAREKPVVMICSNERTGPYPFDVRHRTINSYKTESPSDFKAIKETITKRLDALLKEQETVAQIAHSDPIASVEGLTQVEVAVLAIIAGNVEHPADWSTPQVVRRAMERAGFTRLAVSLALHRLTKKRLIEQGFIDGPGTILSLSEEGWAWIDRNEDKFNLKEPPDEPDLPPPPAGQTIEDIPF